MFTPVDPKVSFPALEERILAFWREREIFRRSIDERAGAPQFTFYEGPPTANARPGIHHVLARVFKDLIPRYKTMQGYRVPRKAGWDTHGLPVELEIEKELGLKSKPEIEAYGIARFNEQCKESVGRYVEEWTRLTERIAYWADLDNAYVTWHNEYIETGWWIFKQLWGHGMVYQDYRVSPYCSRCGTTLSDHEVSQGYEDDTPDPSVFVKFVLQPPSAAKLREKAQLPGDERISLVAWTTTPWTLPGNTALAVNREAEYGIYRHNGELLVLARALAATVLGDQPAEERWGTGEVLLGLAYEPLYRPELLGHDARRFDEEGRLRPVEAAATEGLRRVIPAGYVSLEDGSGIVHTAPAFGGEDFEQGKEHRLLFLQRIDVRGIMAAGLPGAGAFAKEADNDVIRDLTQRGLMLRSGTTRHTYPFCWRCHTPLLYYAKPSWYIRTRRYREQLLDGNERINWYPEHIKHGRFGNWLENNIDWAVSRERYWGTPLPFWRCQQCGKDACVGSRSELAERAIDRARAEALADLHRPFIDEVLLRCDACGGEMKRVTEVADAWFDSGAMPYAQWHYPFEQAEAFDRSFPADYICEAIDQTRGWFYTLHAEATLLHAAEAVPEGIAFRNVICLGHIQDEKGYKMSKSRGNAVDPWDILDRFGADATRWYMFSAGFSRTSGRFGAGLVEEGLRRFLLTLWNTYSFFVSYANIDQVDPRRQRAAAIPEMDRWLLSELNALVQKVTDELDRYDPTDAARALDGFVDDLSNWYVRRSRRRFWRNASESDSDKQSAYFTLYTALVTLTKLLAPFTPFVAEELWQNLVRSIDPEAPESVHLAEWPKSDPSLIDARLNEETQLVKRVCSLGRAARAKAQIKVRQPVAEVALSVRGNAAAEQEALRRNETLVLEELNAKRLTLTQGDAGLVTFTVKPNLRTLGPRLGSALNAVRGALAELPAEGIDALRRGRPWTVAGYELAADDVILEEHPSEGFEVASEGGYTVAISTVITPQLADEGLARELVRRIQDMRRDAGFELADRITAWYSGDAEVARVMKAQAAYIQGETLSTALLEGAPPAGAQRAEHDLDGVKVTIGLQRA